MTDLPPERQALVDEIRGVQFRTLHFRTGYDRAAVDRLLDSAEEAVVAGEPVADVLHGDLPTASFHSAYDTGEVDAFLDRLRGRG